MRGGNPGGQKRKENPTERKIKQKLPDRIAIGDERKKNQADKVKNIPYGEQKMQSREKKKRREGRKKKKGEFHLVSS